MVECFFGKEDVVSSILTLGTNQNNTGHNVNVKPTAGKLIIKRDKTDTVSKGGIILQTSIKITPFAKVVAENASEQFKVGTTVLVSLDSGSNFSIDDEIYVVIKVEDVLGVRS